MRVTPDSLILGLGANVPGPWGVPQRTIQRALDELRDAGLWLVAGSRLYHTRAMGPGHQPTYVNAVVVTKSHLPPFAILRLLKQIERKAGRRLVRKWGPRPLDIDILDFGGRRLGWTTRRRRPSLVLPHPEMHRRAFVLVPLADALPGWYHPVFGVSARELVRRLAWKGARDGVQALDSPLRSCEKPRK